MRQDKNHESALEAHELEKQYGATTVVSRFNVDIPKGQTVVLWGPNGAGKTTILQ